MSAATWPLQRVPGLLTSHRGSMIIGILSPKVLRSAVGWHENIKTLAEEKKFEQEVWLVLDAGSSVWIPCGWGTIYIGLDNQRATKLAVGQKVVKQHGGQRTSVAVKQYCCASFLPCVAPSVADHDASMAAEMHAWLVSHRTMIPTSLKQFAGWKSWMEALGKHGETAESSVTVDELATAIGLSGLSDAPTTGKEVSVNMPEEEEP